MQENNQKTLSEIRKEIVFNAPIQKVWDVVSTSEGMAMWFMPNDFEQKVGHEFHLQSPFGPSPCKVLEFDPPYRLTFSWDNFGWQVSFELRELEGKTQFTLIHSGWGLPDEIIPAPQASQTVVRDRMNHGWDGIVYEKLRKVVEG